MFNATIKFLQVILPIIVIVFIYGLENREAGGLEFSGTLLWFVFFIPLIVFFSWDLAECVYKFRKIKEYFGKNSKELWARLIFFFIILILISYLIVFLYPQM